jgi:hypothetical protein
VLGRGGRSCPLEPHPSPTRPDHTGYSGDSDTTTKERCPNFIPGPIPSDFLGSHHERPTGRRDGLVLPGTNRTRWAYCRQPHPGTTGRYPGVKSPNPLHDGSLRASPIPSLINLRPRAGRREPEPTTRGPGTGSPRHSCQSTNHQTYQPRSSSQIQYTSSHIPNDSATQLDGARTRISNLMEHSTESTDDQNTSNCARDSLPATNLDSTFRIGARQFNAILTKPYKRFLHFRTRSRQFCDTHRLFCHIYPTTCLIFHATQHYGSTRLALPTDA